MAGAERGAGPAPQGRHPRAGPIGDYPPVAALDIEVKLSATVRNDAVKHLNWLHDTIGDDLLDRVLITTGTEAYRRADGVAVVLAGLLGP